MERKQRKLYLDLVPPDVCERITFVQGPGRSGPQSNDLVDFLFIDGSHEREDTILTFKVWHDVISPGGRIVFHDYLDPGNPGVTEAIETLQLDGYRRGRMFVWTRNGQDEAIGSSQALPTSS